MGLLKTIFRGDKAATTTQFQDSEADDGPASWSARRRELVQMVLRDTMRQHGIPSDWMDCVILSVVNGEAATGMHVHLVVKKGHDRLLPYVPAFQESVMNAIRGFEPRASDWLMSLCWQFDGMKADGFAMPSPSTWATSGPQPLGTHVGLPGQTKPGPVTQAESEMEQDLRALLAIRDAAIRSDGADDAKPGDFQATRPGF